MHMSYRCALFDYNQNVFDYGWHGLVSLGVGDGPPENLSWSRVLLSWSYSVELFGLAQALLCVWYPGTSTLRNLP